MSYFDYDNRSIYYSTIGSGEPLLLLHGNTASGRMFESVTSILADRYTVIRMDFLGCGQSERITEWPIDLWYQWGEQAAALLRHLGQQKVNVIGCSGGALAALNLALEHPELINNVAADSFEGVCANASLTEQIRTARGCAKQMEGFRIMQKAMHGEDWETVVDADTDAVIRHAREIGDFFHRPLSSLQAKLLLTGSAEDEMFPTGHYEVLFDEISRQVKNCTIHIFARGNHPSMMSNACEYVELIKKIF